MYGASLSEYFIYIIESIFAFCLIVNAVLFVPQAMKIYKSKSSKDVSVITFLGFNFIQIITILHGYIRGDFILILGTMVSFILCGAVTILAYKYRK